jgi:hypothetical protein
VAARAAGAAHKIDNTQRTRTRITPLIDISTLG